MDLGYPFMTPVHAQQSNRTFIAALHIKITEFADLFLGI